MAGHQNVSVLLIEGDAPNAWPVSALLDGVWAFEFRLISAPTLAAGIETLKTLRLDVVLLVVDTPNFQSVSLLRDEHCARPIIVLGSADDPILAAEAESRGAADYLPAGSSGSAIVRAITRALSRLDELRQLKEALAEEHNLLRAVIDAIPDHIYVKDMAHQFRLANIATQRFFGVSDGILAGKTDADFFSPEAASSFKSEEQQVMISGQPRINREERVISPTGQLQWKLTTKVPLRDQRDKVVGIVGITRDITERKSAVEQLESAKEKLEHRERELLIALANLKQSHDALQSTQLQLLQVEKMESVGRLAAGIAHEVKNPLAIITTGIDYLSQTAAGKTEGDPLHRVLGSMSRAVKRADSVIRGLLDFSAPAALCAEPCDLNLVIRQALVLIDHEVMRCGVSLLTELADCLPQVSVDPNKLEQVFLNLFINAIHAMPDGGKLTLRTRSERLTAVGHNVGETRTERFRAGDHVVIAEVDDTGHGIPHDKLAKLFDPFFTTKPTGKGTGLGLSVARTIVELHGGMLQLTNRPEGGARALLILKATGDSTDDNDQSSQEAGFDRGRRAGLHAHDGNGAAADRAV